MEIIKTNVVARTVAQLTQFSSGLDKIEIWISLASIGLDMKTINVIGEVQFPLLSTQWSRCVLPSAVLPSHAYKMKAEGISVLFSNGKTMKSKNSGV